VNNLAAGVPFDLLRTGLCVCRLTAFLGKSVDSRSRGDTGEAFTDLKDLKEKTRGFKRRSLSRRSLISASQSGRDSRDSRVSSFYARCVILKEGGGGGGGGFFPAAAQ